MDKKSDVEEGKTNRKHAQAATYQLLIGLSTRRHQVTKAATFPPLFLSSNESCCIARHISHEKWTKKRCCRRETRPQTCASCCIPVGYRVINENPSSNQSCDVVLPVVSSHESCCIARHHIAQKMDKKKTLQKGKQTANMRNFLSVN